MLLAWHRREQDSRSSGWTRKRVDRATQGQLQLFGVKVFLEYLQLAAHPAVAHGPIERRDGLENESLDYLALLQIRQRRMTSGRVVRIGKGKYIALNRWSVRDAAC